MGFQECDSDDPDGREGTEVQRCFETMFIACVQGASAYMKLRDGLAEDEPLVNLISLTADNQREIMSLIDKAGARLKRALIEVGEIMGDDCKEAIIGGLVHYMGEDLFKRYCGMTDDEFTT